MSSRWILPDDQTEEEREERRCRWTYISLSERVQRMHMNQEHPLAIVKAEMARDKAAERWALASAVLEYQQREGGTYRQSRSFSYKHRIWDRHHSDGEKDE